MIFLPSGWAAWSREKLKAVVIHELAHVKRRDALANAAAQLACALLWFDPLAWVARGMMLREAEASCDRAVLAHGVSSSGYASTIVDILWRAGGAPLHGAWSTLGRRKMLRRRIAHILRPSPRPDDAFLRRGRIVVLAVCLAAPIFLLSVTFRGTDRLFGTWERPAVQVLQRSDGWSEPPAAYLPYPELSDIRTTWNEDGTGSTAYAALPDVTTRQCRYAVEQRWKDAAGFTWYHLLAYWSSMPFPLYTLIRLHPSGNLYEMADSPSGYPARFIGPPGDEKHQIFVRR